MGEEVAPRRSLLGLGRLRAWMMEILKAHLTPRSVGLAVALGVFIGVLPIYGLHFFACVLVARWLGLNQAVLYAAANISNPFFAPFLVAAEVQLGGWLRQSPPSAGNLEGSLWEMIQQAPGLFWDCLLGSLFIGLLLAPPLGLLAAWGLGWWRLRNRPAEG